MPYRCNDGGLGQLKRSPSRSNHLPTPKLQGGHGLSPRKAIAIERITPCQQDRLLGPVCVERAQNTPQGGMATTADHPSEFLLVVTPVITLPRLGWYCSPMPYLINRTEMARVGNRPPEIADAHDRSGSVSNDQDRRIAQRFDPTLECHAWESTMRCHRAVSKEDENRQFRRKNDVYADVAGRER